MKDNTSLYVNDFGPINNAKIDIGKINIIGGQNASGKTTLSKIFYSLLGSVSSDGEKLLQESLKKKLLPLISDILEDYPLDEKLKELYLKLKYLDATNMAVEDIYDDFIDYTENKINLDEHQEEKNVVDQLMCYRNDQKGSYFQILNSLFNIEFAQELSENFSNSDIIFTNHYPDNGFFIQIQIHDDKQTTISCSEKLDKFLKVPEVLYIETPHILDFSYIIDYIHVSDRQSSYHQDFLMEKLKEKKDERNIFDKKLNKTQDEILEKIDEIVGGYIEHDSSFNDFVFHQDGKKFKSQNIATGIKIIGILQVLLRNRRLVKDSFLIMDEPEVHLHPEWQVKLAEVIVILSKKLNITFYINSHSPQFVEAIEVYTKKYEIDDETNFYLTEEDTRTGKYNFNKIDREDLIDFYDKLSHPYKILNEIRRRNLLK